MYGIAGSISNAGSANLGYPSTLSLTAWWRAPFISSPWRGTISSNKLSYFNTLIEPTNPPSSTVYLNNYPVAVFDGSNDQLKFSLLPNGSDFSTLFTTTAYSYAILFYADVAAADAGNANSYDNPHLLGDSTSTSDIGCAFSDSGVRAWHFASSNWTSVAVACSTGSWHLVQVKYDGSNLKTRVDSGSWSSQSRASATLSGQPAFGRNYTGSKRFTGKIAEILITNTALDDATFDNIKSYINTRYLLSL